MPLPPQIREATDPGPQPERLEPPLDDPGLTDLSLRDWRAVFMRAGKQALADGITDVAASLAYYAFLAIPALLLVTLGVFANAAGQDTVDSILDTLDGVVPPEAIQLIDESLTRTLENQGGGVLMIVVGGLLAIWTATSAMGGLMRGLNRVYATKETRGFARQRLVGLAILGLVLLAFALVFGLLVLGPVLSTAVGEATDATTLVGWLWWTLQWPIVLVGLLLAFAAILYFGPNVEVPKFRFITPGALLAVVLWILSSGLFALYVGFFGSYDKTWGSLAAVIVMLTWLWLTALALLLGAEVNAEAERSRRLREAR
jgi:membrane protein